MIRKALITYRTRYIENKYRIYITDVKEKVISHFLQDDSILDLGVGTGRFALHFSRNHEYIGVDLSSGMLKVAKKKFSENEKVKLLQMDAENLGFSDNSFANVICIHTFKFFSDPLKVLKEGYRILKDGGKILIFVESKERFIQGLTIRGRRKEKILHACNLYSRKEVFDMFKEAGFKVIYSKNFFIFPVSFYKFAPKFILKHLWQYDKTDLKFGNDAFVVGEKC